MALACLAPCLFSFARTRTDLLLVQQSTIYYYQMVWFVSARLDPANEWPSGRKIQLSLPVPVTTVQHCTLHTAHCTPLPPPTISSAGRMDARPQLHRPALHTRGLEGRRDGLGSWRRHQLADHKQMLQRPPLQLPVSGGAFSCAVLFIFIFYLFIFKCLVPVDRNDHPARAARGSLLHSGLQRVWSAAGLQGAAGLRDRGADNNRSQVTN